MFVCVCVQMETCRAALPELVRNVLAGADSCLLCFGARRLGTLPRLRSSDRSFRSSDRSLPPFVQCLVSTVPENRRLEYAREHRLEGTLIDC